MIAHRRLWWSILLGLVFLLPLACNLTTIDPTVTPFPTATPFVRQSTATPTATTAVTPTPTKTAAPPKPTAKPVYNLSQPVPAPICAIVPNVEASNIRSGPGTNFPVTGVMLANNWVMANRLTASGWYQIVAMGTVVNGGWISSSVVNLQQPCICTPDSCTQSGIVPPTAAPSGGLPRVGVVGLVPADGKACIVTAGGSDVPIFRIPGDDTSVLAILIPYGGVGASSFSDGRYSVVFNVGAQALSGWVNANRVTVQGGCEQLRVPVVCSVQAPIGTMTQIHTEPRRDAPVITTMNEFLPAAFIQKNADGWFNVDTGGAGKGWVAPDEGVLVGPC